MQHREATLTHAQHAAGAESVGALKLLALEQSVVGEELQEVAHRAL